MRFHEAFIRHLLLICFFLLSANCLVSKINPLEENELVEKPKVALEHSNLLNILKKLSVSTQEIQTDVGDPLIQNSIDNNSKVLNPHPLKRRVKRFTCWHSCLGPWRKKNPKLKAYRYQIQNVAPASTTQATPITEEESIPATEETNDKDGDGSETTDDPLDPNTADDTDDNDDKQEEKRQLGEDGDGEEEFEDGDLEDEYPTEDQEDDGNTLVQEDETDQAV